MLHAGILLRFIEGGVIGDVAGSNATTSANVGTETDGDYDRLPVPFSRRIFLCEMAGAETES